MDREREQRFLDTLWEEQRRRGLSDAKLSQELGVNQSTISRLKSGKLGVSVDTLFRLAEHFPTIRELLMMELLTGTKQRASKKGAQAA